MTLDLTIIGAYLLLLVGIGLVYRRYAAKGLDQFFLAGRNVPGWLNGVAYAAAMVSADAATAYGGLAVVTGAFVCWWYLSRFALPLFVGAVLFAVYWRRLGLFTSMEFYELRFTGKAASGMRTWVAARTCLIAMPAWTGITLLASHKVLGPTFGIDNKGLTILVTVGISFLCILLAGYKGIVVSNAMQMGVFLAGAACLALFTLSEMGGPAGLAARLRGELGPAGGAMLALVPPREHPVFPLTAALAWVVGQTLGYGGDAAPLGGAMEGQRILSSRSPREAIAMYVVTAVVMFTLVLLVSLPCVAAAVLWPELRGAAADRKLAYGMLMRHVLPPGALGLVVAAMLAGIMSTVGDNLNFGGQVMLNDLYRRWLVPNKSERHYLLAGKACMGAIMLLSLAVAWKATIIYDVAVFMLTLSAAEMPANWAQWWWWRFNGPARLAASFGGAVVFCIVVLGPKLLAWLGVAAASAYELQWWNATFLVMGLTTLLWVGVALATRPEPMECLLEFHRRARPLGWWGPVARLAAARDVEENMPDGAAPTPHGLGPILRGLVIAAIGAGASALFIVGLSSLYIDRWQAGIGCLAAAVAAGVLFGWQLKRFLVGLGEAT